MAAPVLALLTATKLLPAPVAVALGLLLAVLLRGRLGGARLAPPPWGRTADAVALLLAAAAVRCALKSMRPLKNRPAATHVEAGIRPKLPLGRSKDGGAAAATAEKHGAVGAIKAEKATAARAMADAAKAEVGAAVKQLAAADAREAKADAAAKAKAAAGAPKAAQGDQDAAAKRKARASAAVTLTLTLTPTPTPTLTRTPTSTLTLTLTLTRHAPLRPGPSGEQ